MASQIHQNGDEADGHSYWQIEQALLFGDPKVETGSSVSPIFDSLTALIVDALSGNCAELFRSTAAHPFAAISRAVTDFANTTDVSAFIQNLKSAVMFHLASADGERINELRMMALGALSLRLFLRANWTGPPVDQDPSPLPPLFTTGDANLGSTSAAFNGSLKKILSVEGEIVQELIRIPMALILSRIVFFELLGNSSLVTLPAWQARVSLVHQRALSGGRKSPCRILMATGISGLIEWLQVTGALSDEFVITGQPMLPSTPGLPPFFQSVRVDWSPHARRMLHLELAAALSTYGLHDAFKTLYDVSRDVLGFSAQLVGRLGIKRKYQQTAVPQLVLELISDEKGVADVTTAHANRDVGSNGVAAASLVDAAAEGTAPTTNRASVLPSGIAPRAVKLTDLDPDTDIFENPQFRRGASSTEVAAGGIAEAPATEEPNGLTVDQQLFLLAWSNCLFETAPTGDELAMHVILAIIRECVKLPKKATTEDEFHDAAVQSKEELMLSLNWLVFSYALWMRSKAEFDRTKWKERSCLQMMHLEEQFKDSKPSAGHRLRHIFQLDFPNVWEMKLEIGRRFMKIGATLTAKKMFEDMHMWDECVQCLAIAQRKHEALDLVKAKLAECPTPALYCSLGDLTHDAEAYHKAWELSGRRYCRVARSLGNLALEQDNDLIKAIHWFEEAVKLQPMQPRTQFTLGCCLMRSGNFKRAIEVFGFVTAAEPDCSDAWANLASIHARMENWEAAKRCISLAAKEQRTSWQIWDTYAKVAMKCGDVYGALEAASHLVELDRCSEIEIWMLNFFAKELMRKARELGALNANVDNEEERTGNRLAFESLLKRCLEFFAQYFNRYSLPLLNDPQSRDTVDAVVDRYRIWSVLTQIAALKRTTWEIRLKQLRHLGRIIDDVATHGIPPRLRPESPQLSDNDGKDEHEKGINVECTTEEKATKKALAKAFDELLGLLATTVNELFSYADEFKTTLSRDDALNEMRTCGRFLNDTFGNCKNAISGTALPIEEADRSALIDQLHNMRTQVESFIRKEAGEKLETDADIRATSPGQEPQQ